LRGVPRGMKVSTRIVIGLWHSSGLGDADWPHPQSLVDHAWERDRRVQIVAYLNAGNFLHDSCGSSDCRFGCRSKWLKQTQDPTRGIRLRALESAYGMPPGYWHEVDGDYMNGFRDQSDGVWLWPEGLAHYVDKHGIRLPDEFVAHAASREFRPPDPEPDPALYCVVGQRDFWADWCRKNAPFEYEANCSACRESSPSSTTNTADNR
jgi:hypothetical protein